MFHMRIFLNKGDEIPRNQTQANHLPKEMIRVVDGITFVDLTIVLGRREAMAGVEHALMGMKVGGDRKVRVSPNLERAFYLNSPNAVLICKIWLRNSTGSSSVESLPGVT